MPKFDISLNLNNWFTTYGLWVGAFVLVFLILITALIIIFTAYFIKRQDQFDKLLAMLIGPLKRLKRFSKLFVTFDTQGKLNSFIRSLAEIVIGYEPVGVRLKWIDDDINKLPQVLEEKDGLVVVMGDSGNQNKNLVRATVAVLGKSVLDKAKHYLSKPQSESLDLFVAKKLFEKEKPKVMDEFFREFFKRKINSSEIIATLINKYELMDRVGLFFSVFIQELTFLGEKVYLSRKNDVIVREVNSLIDFLEKYAKRESGDETTPLVYRGSYCRCSIVIIAKYMKMRQGKVNPYINHIKRLVRQRIENFYILGPAGKENAGFMNDVAEGIRTETNLEFYVARDFSSQILIHGSRKKTQTRLMVFRSQNITRVYDEELQRIIIDSNPIPQEIELTSSR